LTAIGLVLNNLIEPIHQGWSVMSINAEIDKIYETTRQQFTEWAKSEDPSFRNAACPETLRASFGKADKDTGGPAKTGDPVGFQILWTPVSHKPKFLICGSCPTSFGSHEDNVKYLKGQIPSENIYIGAPHKFGQELTAGFAECGREDLFRDCVGLNVWHFQFVGLAQSNPYHDDVAQFCENQTKKIIELVEPEMILSLGDISFDILEKDFPSNLHHMAHPTSKGGEFKKQLRALITG
jgi:hypothetical protein